MQKMRLLRNNRGFTLVEAMVVVAIVGIMSLVSYSGFSGLLQREKATAAANQLMGHIKEAKMLAMEKHVSHAVDLNINQNVYTIYRDTDNSCSRDAGEAIVHQVNVAQDFTNVIIDNNSTITQFRFDPKGMPKRAGGGFAAGRITLKFVPPNAPNTYKRKCDLTLTNMGRIDVISCTDL